MVPVPAFITTSTIVRLTRVVLPGTDGNVSALQGPTTMATKTAFQLGCIVRIRHSVQHPVHPMAKRIPGTAFVILDITGQTRV